MLKLNGLPPEEPVELCFGPKVLKIAASIPELEDARPAQDVVFVGNLLGELKDSVICS